MSLLYHKSKNVKELNHNHFSLSNLNKQLKPNLNKPSLIIFYAHWCPHCHSPHMIELMEALGQVLPHKANIYVAAFNCDYNSKHRDIAQNIDINGFPTIRFYNKNNDMSEYNGPREIEPLLKFLLQNS